MMPSLMRSEIVNTILEAPDIVREGAYTNWCTAVSSKVVLMMSLCPPDRAMLQRCLGRP